jgi:hypothetical protein
VLAPRQSASAPAAAATPPASLRPSTRLDGGKK